ncbi:MAG: single-strand DNA-binding protein [Acidimicrobiaceae bacterium]|nr:single-strand DNA-binding protein [Acidimicrobiaceae bacterium]
MSAINSVTIIVGNLTRDPELRFLVAGEATADLSVAVSRRWENPTTHESEEKTSFLEVVCWGDLAKNVAASARRGSRVVVTARLEQRSWQSKGRHRSKLELVADEVALSLRFATASVEGTTAAGQADASPAA